MPVRLTARLAAYGAILATLTSKVAVMIANGWTATGDDATIALRAYDSLRGRGPLVGQYSELTLRGHPVYDAGPLQYWLMAVPVRIAPHYGPLIGAAFWCAVAAVLAIEASTAAAGALGGLIAAAAVVGAVAWQPLLGEDPTWNPYMGLMFFISAVAATVAVLYGSRRWWPVAVVSASIAAQSHLMYAVGAVLLVALSGIVAMEATRRQKGSWRWATTGLGLGLACWAAPLFQQLTSANGNLSAIVSAAGAQRGAGLSFGLRALAATSFPRPIWWVPAADEHGYAGILHSSTAIGVLVLCFLSAVLVAAWRRHHRLAALAGVSLVLAVAVVVSFAGVPPSRSANIGYLKVVLFPTGVLIWLVLSWSLARGTAQVVSRLSIRQGLFTSVPPELAAVTPPGGSTSETSGAFGRPSPKAGFAAMAVLLLVCTVLACVRFTPMAREQPAYVAAVGATARAIERSVRPGPVDLGYRLTRSKEAGEPMDFLFLTGVAWDLQQAGWSPLVPGAEAVQLGLMYDPRSRVPGATVAFVGRHVRVDLSRRAD